MKKFGEYDMKKLSDSRLLYLRDPPKFTYIFAIFVIAILIGTLIWSATAVKAEQVQTRGIITTEDKNPFFSEMSGTISYVNYKEGENVSIGDVLAEFDKSDINLELNKLNTQYNMLTDRISHIDTFITEINESNPSQPFQNSGSEMEFYIMFQQYLLNLSKTTTPDQVDELRYQTQIQLISERNTRVSNKSDVEKDIDAYTIALAKYDIKATISGIVHYDIQIVPGIVLQTGTQIGSISDPDAKKIIEMYIPSSERSKIETGQDCRFTIDGLAQTEYGSLKGVVKSISSDAILQDGTALFKVIIEFDATEIEDSKGNKIKISNGMTARVWITYEKVTYLKYWKEKLGLDELF